MEMQVIDKAGTQTKQSDIEPAVLGEKNMSFQIFKTGRREKVNKRKT